MALTSRATLNPPVGGKTGEASAEQSRKIRCRVTDRLRNPCSNEALSDAGWCLKHLREAAAEWERLKQDAVAEYPQLARLFDADAD